MTGSVVNGAVIGRGARLRDSILCRGVKVGDGAVLQSGCVIGEKADIGAEAQLHAGVLVWPEKSCESGADIRFNITSRAPREPLGFNENTAISGEPDGMLTPEFCTSLGIAAAMACGREPRIGIGCENVPACGMLATALECGIRAGGARAVRCGGSLRRRPRLRRATRRSTCASSSIAVRTRALRSAFRRRRPPARTGDRAQN